MIRTTPADAVDRPGETPPSVADTQAQADRRPRLGSGSAGEIGPVRAPLLGNAGPAEAAQRVVERYRVPVDDARELLISGLNSGAIAFTVVGFGCPRAGTQEDLARGDIDFDTGEIYPAGAPRTLAMAVEDGSVQLLTFVVPSVRVDLVSLDRYAAAVFGSAVTAAGPKLKGRAIGRPRLHKWDRLGIALGCRVVVHGLPASRGVLLEEARSWFVETTGEIPDDKDLRGFIEQVWPEFEHAHLSGICELGPPDGGAK